MHCPAVIKITNLRNREKKEREKQRNREKKEREKERNRKTEKRKKERKIENNFNICKIVLNAKIASQVDENLT